MDQNIEPQIGGEIPLCRRLASADFSRRTGIYRMLLPSGGSDQRLQVTNGLWLSTRN